MHKDPTAYFTALGALGEKLKSMNGNWDKATCPLESEMLILTGALYLRKLDEHGALNSKFALAGKTVKAVSGEINVKVLCDRLIHSKLIETTNFNEINFETKPKKDGDPVVSTTLDGLEIVNLLINYSKNGGI